VLSARDIDVAIWLFGYLAKILNFYLNDNADLRRRAFVYLWAFVGNNKNTNSH